MIKIDNDFDSRQIEIAKRLAKGQSPKTISHEMNLSRSSVYNELGRMKLKAEVDNQWRLIVYCKENLKDLK